MSTALLRIDKLLSNRGYCSRKEVSLLIKQGSIMEGTSAVTKSDQKVDPTVITIDGEPIDPGEGLSLILHKPTGYVCSHRDKGRLIFELLPERYGNRKPPLSSVGRLDKETSGLLILTDDGEFNHQLTSPNKKVGKTYEVKTSEPLSGTEQSVFESGSMVLSGESSPLLPAMWQQTGSHEGKLTIFEGRYHQVRRMFESLGNKVETLHRSHIGSLQLGDLSCGEWRPLTEHDRALLLTRREY